MGETLNIMEGRRVPEPPELLCNSTNVTARQFFTSYYMTCNALKGGVVLEDIGERQQPSAHMEASGKEWVARVGLLYHD